MTERRFDMPTAPQRQAADPSASAWVGANAGSGKTRVLTQRVARLLLAGAEPEKILCLTYTKAAAAEMQTRLFATLGAWAMRPDNLLAAELGALEGGPPIGDPPRLAAARRLFARALETPGGLKIQTIHAFCEALLRRFPLEAGVSPGFQVLDDRQAALMLDGLRADLARAAEAGVEDAFDRIAQRLNEGAVAEIAAQVLSRRDGFRAADLAPSLAAHFGQVAGKEKAALIAASLDRLDWVDLAAHADLLIRLGGKADLALAEALRTAAHQREASPEAAGEALLKTLLTKEGKPRSTKGFPVNAVVTADPQALPRAQALLVWAEAISDDLKAAETCARATDLHRFGRALIEAYATAKRARGLLDFDDLIGRAADLLADPDLGPWALYKLDQGIDHVLVDEAQDTSPRQWAVIRALLGDFFAGEGARGVPRTLFVVGDEKQSIYSFQGAEPEAFGAARDWAAARLGDIGARLERPDLVTSFRSAPGILSFVDAVFAGEAGAGLTVEETPITHLAHRKGDGARVDLWPLIEPPEKPDDLPWGNPVDLPPRNNPKSVLAEHLATEIARMIAEETLPARAGEAPRRVTPGDILVLVRKRDRLAQTLIQRLKSLGVPVAGADRLSLAGELAVKDLLALIKAVIQPLDELSLAAVLRSPLCDMDEEALFELAHGREGTLWQALMAGDTPSPDREMLRDLASRAGFLGPYDFLERVLIRHDGRRRLVARLGLEAEDPLDELLAEALSYEARE
ncbi:MAG: UvrD-helicase domain-containing protein, partial [Pseudomonadota bacterium]